LVKNRLATQLINCTTVASGYVVDVSGDGCDFMGRSCQLHHLV
jgi:hypothetical protein